MDENPYKSPKFGGRAEPKPDTWHPLTWALIGFVGGTGLMAPLFLSVDELTNLLCGMMSGGIIGAICGLAYGIKRRR